MTKTRGSLRVVLLRVTATAILTVAVFFAIGLVTILGFRMPFYLKILRISAGDPRTDVIAILGPPQRECPCTDIAPCVLDGYEKPEVPDCSHVLVYTKADLVFYVFLDEANELVDTFTGGS